MNWSRVSYIVKISLWATLRRIRYDFAREIVVGVSALVLGALFLYIFNDFINVKALYVSGGSQKALAGAAALLLLLVASVFLRGRLAAEGMGRGVVCRFLGDQGETPAVIKAFLAIRAIALPIIVYAICWLVIERYFAVWSLSSMAGIQAILVAVLAMSLKVGGGTQRAKGVPRALLNLDEIGRIGKNATLLRWRGRQLLLRNRVSRFSLCVAALFLLLALCCRIMAAPLLLAAAASLMVGIFLATAMCMQVAEDLKCGWMEPFMGISHRMFVNSYYLIGTLLGGAFGLVEALFYLASGAPGGFATMIQAMQLLAIVMVFPLLAPSLLFQLDARRPILTIFAGTLIALFIGTAIYVHLASVLILPVVVYYADDYQNNRFYTSYSQH